MADKRMIRDWTTSKKVDLLSQGAEIFFTRLIMKVDDFGNYTANPKLINAALFPLKDYTKVEISGWMEECFKAGLIGLYDEDSGDSLLQILNFDQKLRRYHATYPPPSDGKLRTSDGQVTASCGQKTAEEKRREVEDEVEENTKAQDFDELFLRAFDEITCDRFKMTYSKHDLRAELQQFRTKCDNDPKDYHNRDVGGLRKAFQYQLDNRKNGKSRTSTGDKFTEAARIIASQQGTD